MQKFPHSAVKSHTGIATLPPQHSIPSALGKEKELPASKIHILLFLCTGSRHKPNKKDLIVVKEEVQL